MNPTRRLVISGMALLAGVCALPSRVLAREYRGGWPWKPKASNPPVAYDPEVTFLSPDERDFITAAVDRLIPADEYVSASEAGVVDFIDHQLAGQYGRGDIYYLTGPFDQGTESQGYQGPAPAVLYRSALHQIQAFIQEKYQGLAFNELSPGEQDELLEMLESDAVPMQANVSSKMFFETLLQNTKEGYFGDPIYGGNKDMVSWRMLGFPGTRYDYRAYLSKQNEPLELVPVSLGSFQSLTDVTKR